MRDEEFSNWLINIDGRDNRQKSDSVSRVRRIEKSFTEYLRRLVNIDVEYIEDRCSSIIEMLSIDYVYNIPKAINLSKNSSGLSTLSTSIKKYIKFCDGENK